VDQRRVPGGSVSFVSAGAKTVWAFGAGGRAGGAAGAADFPGDHSLVAMVCGAFANGNDGDRGVVDLWVSDSPGGPADVFDEGVRAVELAGNAFVSVCGVPALFPALEERSPQPGLPDFPGRSTRGWPPRAPFPETTNPAGTRIDRRTDDSQPQTASGFGAWNYSALANLHTSASPFENPARLPRSISAAVSTPPGISAETPPHLFAASAAASLSPQAAVPRK